MMYIFISLGFIPKSRVAKSCGNSVFNILRNWQTVFQNGYTVSHSHQPYRRVPVPPHPLWCLFVFLFFIWGGGRIGRVLFFKKLMYSCKIFYVTGIQYSGLQFLKFLVHLSYKILAIFQVVQYILVAIFHDFFFHYSWSLWHLLLLLFYYSQTSGPEVVSH